MRLTDSMKRWTAVGSAAAALSLTPGCAGPRTRVATARVSAAASARNSPGSAAATARDPGRPPTAAAANRKTVPVARRSGSVVQPSSDLGRGVARFTTRPAEIFDPPTPIRPWRFIILHHSGEPHGGLASIDRYHREVNHWDECGYHFVIGNGTESGDGEIEVGGRWLKQKHGAHTRVESNPGSNLYNEEGIGICLIGNFDMAAPTAKQVEACRRLVAYLQDRCDVPMRGVTTHGDLDRTECPGRYFPRGQLIPNGGFAARP